MTGMFRLLAAMTVAALLQACSVTPPQDDVYHGTPAVFSTGFESGNLGRVVALNDGATWQLNLRDDNDDASLPDDFRTWFYFSIDHIARPHPVTLEIGNFGWRYPVRPVYSYDRKTWTRFSDDEVSWHGCTRFTLSSCKLTITKSFAADRVWIARYFPYTTQDLAAFLQQYQGSPYLKVETLALAPQSQQPIDMLTIADPVTNQVSADKKYVWIQARTHPGETGSSFVVEGLVARLLADDDLGRALRARYVFKIVPIHNVDGVILGNYRTTASSANLEDSWVFDANGATPADQPMGAPPEDVALMQNGILPLVQSGARFALALNLHSSNAKPDEPAFFIPHFGSDPDKYSEAEQRLWQKQLRFMSLTSRHYDERIEPADHEGGAEFLEEFYPERWWWTRQQDAVNAITLETTYGRAGFDHWVTQDDQRQLGDALAHAIDEMEQE